MLSYKPLWKHNLPPSPVHMSDFSSFAYDDPSHPAPQEVQVQNSNDEPQNEGILQNNNAQPQINATESQNQNPVLYDSASTV
jgi:hypothetical protein